MKRGDVLYRATDEHPLLRIHCTDEDEALVIARTIRAVHDYLREVGVLPPSGVELRYEEGEESVDLLPLLACFDALSELGLPDDLGYEIDPGDIDEDTLDPEDDMYYEPDDF